MKVTVAICTWNRAALLRRTLEGMARLTIPRSIDWEIVVVNNNCTDNTDEVIASYTNRLPVRPVFEATSGHSHARNRAVAESTGELIVWTDDDVQVDADWLAAFAAAAEANSDAAFFAGPIAPWFEDEPPDWMARHIRELSGVIVCVDHGPNARPLQAGEAIFGANMAVRRQVAEAFPFDTRLGRVKDGLVGGDDTDFLRRLIESGHSALWVPTARLRHFVPRTRMTNKYVRQWYRDAGRTWVRRSGTLEGPFVAGTPRWVLRRYLIEQVKRYLLAAHGGVRWFDAFCQANRLEGIIRESRWRYRHRQSTAP